MPRGVVARTSFGVAGRDGDLTGREAQVSGRSIGAILPGCEGQFSAVISRIR